MTRWRWDRWADAAKARPLVTLDDGRTGRLIYVHRQAQVAKVVVAGRHVRVPVSTLTLAEDTPS